MRTAVSGNPEAHVWHVLAGVSKDVQGEDGQDHAGIKDVESPFVRRDVTGRTVDEFSHTVDGSDEDQAARNVDEDEQFHPVGVERCLAVTSDAVGRLRGLLEVAAFDVEADTDDREETEGDDLHAKTGEDDGLSGVEL